MFAVVDVETTGFSVASDRIVELAIVGMDAETQIEWAWHTLINPLRDVGPTHVHGIRARDVVDAPTFEEIAGRAAQLLQGRLLIGHNVSFDQRFIHAAFQQLGHVDLPKSSICTMQTAKSIGIRPTKLTDVCDAFGVTNQHPHQALGDALATAEVWQELNRHATTWSKRNFISAQADLPAWPAAPVYAVDGCHRIARKTAATTPRGTGSESSKRSDLHPRKSSAVDAGRNLETGGAAKPTVSTASAQPSHSHIDIPVLTFTGSDAHYFAAVQRAVEDRVLDTEESKALKRLADDLGISEDRCHQIHQRVLEAQSATAWSDGRIIDGEFQDLVDLAEALRLELESVDVALGRPVAVPVADSRKLHRGDRIVFTGDMDTSRSTHAERAKQAGLIVTGGVSGKTTALVVADSATQSNKAKAARTKGIRVISEHSYERLLADLRSNIE